LSARETQLQAFFVVTRADKKEEIVTAREWRGASVEGVTMQSL
jgi:hypothetical protein